MSQCLSPSFRRISVTMVIGRYGRNRIARILSLDRIDPNDPPDLKLINAQLADAGLADP